MRMQETTPLAGSSAGAIVCAVIASGASMEEALNATKMLAEDCRNRGTAFRLGVCLYVVVFIVRCLCLFTNIFYGTLMMMQITLDGVVWSGGLYYQLEIGKRKGHLSLFTRYICFCDINVDEIFLLIDIRRQFLKSK